MTMDSCIFCKILRKEIPAEFVYDNDTVAVFLDVKPINAGHMLVVPKAHYADLVSTPEDALREVMGVAQHVAKAAMKGLKAPAFNIGVNNGAAAGQVVPHMHLHVMPRYENDGYELWHGKSYEPGEAAKAAEAIRSAL